MPKALLPVQVREATIVPGSFNADDNSVDVVWTTGSRRRAYDWYNDTMYEEELDVRAGSVDMTRFEAGVVQVLDGHMTYGGVRNILGIALTGEIKGGEGLARIKLSTDPAKSGVVGDIRAGIIRSISFGYSVQKYEVTQPKARSDGGTIPLYRAVAWTPHEISFVTVPADPNASTRSLGSDGKPVAPQGGMPCEFIITRAEAAPIPQESAMTEEERRAAEALAEQNRAAAAAEATRAAAALAEQTRVAAVAAEQTRAAAITERCASHGVPALAATLIRENLTVEAAGLRVLDELARRDAAGGGHLNANRISNGDQDELATRMSGMLEAVEHRVNPRAALTDNGRQYRGMSILEMGREFLQARGVNTRGLDRMSLAGLMLNTRMSAVIQMTRAGSMTVSDFPSLMANVANKRLRSSYDENPGTYTRWARRAPNLPDFKNVTVAQMSAMPDLLRTNEHGEFKYGSVSDGAETYALLTYGRIVSLTRQAIVNDDLRAFDRMATGFGASAARLENRTVYAQLTANAALADGGALFNATAATTAGGHANLTTGPGTVISLASLGVGRNMMRLQKGLQLEELNIAPSALIVPSALEQIAYQYTSSQFVPAKSSDVNEFRNGGRTALDPIVEPILDANSATAWYLAANNSQVDTVEYAYLDGAEGPVMDSEMGFEIDGMSLKCRLDFVAKALDFRGLYKNVGA